MAKIGAKVRALDARPRRGRFLSFCLDNPSASGSNLLHQYRP
jgi:hypothetical protein